jgi:hypothetical protein
MGTGFLQAASIDELDRCWVVNKENATGRLLTDLLSGWNVECHVTGFFALGNNIELPQKISVYK